MSFLEMILAKKSSFKSK